MTEINDLVHPALDKLEAVLRDGDIGTAVVYFDRGDEQPFVMSDETYWANANTIANFEQRAARHAKELGCTRFAFVTAAIIAQTEDGVFMRPPNLEMGLREYEAEVMWLIACDLNAGIEIGQVEIIRDEDGGIGFGELYLLQGEAQFEAVAPGFGIIRAVAA